MRKSAPGHGIGEEIEVTGAVLGSNAFYIFLKREGNYYTVRRKEPLEGNPARTGRAYVASSRETVRGIITGIGQGFDKRYYFDYYLNEL